MTSDILAVAETDLAIGAIEFALSKYMEAATGESVDARLEAGRMLFNAAKGALPKLAELKQRHCVVAFDVVGRRGPIGIA